MSESTGRVQSWNYEAGWGVIESPDTPGGCWVHLSSLLIEHRGLGLQAGRELRFVWERLSGNGVQDGYDYVAREAWNVGEQPYRRPLTPDNGAYRTSLTITFDADESEEDASTSPEEFYRPL